MHEFPEFNEVAGTTEQLPHVEPDNQSLESEPKTTTPTVSSEDNIKIDIDQPAINYSVARDYSEPVKIKDEDDYGLAFILENPNTVDKVLNAYNEFLDKLSTEKVVTTEQDREWISNLILGLHFGADGKTPLGATEREGSKWTQGISSNDPEVLLRPGRPTQKIEKGRRYSKEELISYLSRRSGGGGTYDVILPNSGIWLRLREPSLGEVVTMLTEIEETKVSVGLDTKGLAFSNSTATAALAITNLALNCVIEANVNYNSITDLELLISTLDEPILHHALATVMHPDGFNYKVPCINNVSECNEVISFKMIMSNVIWYDDLKFNKEQRRILGRRFSKRSTVEELEVYRESFITDIKDIYWFGEIGVKLQVPNLYQRKEYVNAWIDNLIEMSSGTFDEAPDGHKRSQFIEKLNRATEALHFGQWVKGIYDRFGEEQITNLEEHLITEDPEIIKEYLSDVLSRAEVVEDFFKVVSDFNNENIIGLIALPSHNCPSCDKTQGSVLSERFPHLVPIDVVTVFFTLAGRKVQRVQG